MANKIILLISRIMLITSVISRQSIGKGGSSVVLVTSTAELFGYQKPNATHRVSQPLIGPSPFNLIGFWPLDAETRLGNFISPVRESEIIPLTIGKLAMNPSDDETNTIFFKYEQPQAVSRMALVNEELGPFGKPNTSYTATSYYGLVDYDLAVQPDQQSLISDFSISLYLYKHDLEGEIASLMLGEKTLLKITYSGQQITLHTYPKSGKIATKSYEDPNNVGEWSFLGFSYIHSDQVMRVHRETGDLVAELNQLAIFESQNKILKLAKRNVSLTLRIGKLNPNDRVACLVFYRKTLDLIEMAQMPCLCQMKADFTLQRCMAQRKNTSRETVSMPRKKHLAGFWPLNRASGLFEVAKGLVPSKLGRSARLALSIDQVLGPFNQPESCYSTSHRLITPRLKRTTLQLLEPMAEYVLSNFSRTFTLSFLFYTSTESSFSESQPWGEFVSLSHYLTDEQRRKIRESLSGTKQQSRKAQQYTSFSMSGIPYLALNYKESGKVLVLTGGQPAAQFTLKPLEFNSKWFFFALSYNAKEMLLTGHDQYGQELASFLWVQINKTVPELDGVLGSEQMVKIGFGKVRPGDKMACLALWRKTVLSKDQIAKIIEGCRRQGFADLSSPVLSGVETTEEMPAKYSVASSYTNFTVSDSQTTLKTTPTSASVPSRILPPIRSAESLMSDRKSIYLKFGYQEYYNETEADDHLFSTHTGSARKLLIYYHVFIFIIVALHLYFS